MDDERSSIYSIVGYKITRIETEAYGIKVFGKKGKQPEILIIQSAPNTPCLFDGDGNLFAEIAD
jgi:hypothetical protein